MSPRQFYKVNDSDLFKLHKQLAVLNRQKFAASLALTFKDEIELDNKRTEAEQLWLSQEEKGIQPQLSNVPTQPILFVEWLESLMTSGPGQNHLLFSYLAEHASFDDFEYFMGQELATEAGFDDLVAMTQVQAPHRVKLELGKNYWDELGNGVYDKMHSVQLGWVAEALSIHEADSNYTGVCWQALALSNLMLTLASRRSCFYESIGPWERLK